MKGTQLLPERKLCAEGLRGSIHLPGEKRPVFDSFTEEEVRAIQHICRHKKRLDTVNNIAYVGPEEAEELRRELRAKRDLERFAGMSVPEVWNAMLTQPATEDSFTKEEKLMLQQQRSDLVVDGVVPRLRQVEGGTVD